MYLSCRNIHIFIGDCSMCFRKLWVARKYLYLFCGFYVLSHLKSENVIMGKNVIVTQRPNGKAILQK